MRYGILGGLWNYKALVISSLLYALVVGGCEKETSYYAKVIKKEDDGCVETVFFDTDGNGKVDASCSRWFSRNKDGRVVYSGVKRHYIASREIESHIESPAEIVDGENSWHFTFHEREIEEALKNPDRTYNGEGASECLGSHPSLDAD